MSEHKSADVDSESKAESDQDCRLYVINPEVWKAQVKQTWDKEYCFGKKPDEDFYHLLMCGELYIYNGNEKYCFNCAQRHGLLTEDRVHWQH